MSNERPPTIDPQAAQRWAHHVAMESPWLHEEVARRMEERLQWIVKKPSRWLHWAPLRGGLAAQSLLTQRYPQAQIHIHEAHPRQLARVQKALQSPWWSPARWLGESVHWGLPPHPVDMLWANMALHMEADPQALIRQWAQSLAVDGFLMFSCLGPDTLRELRTVYAEQGWPQPSHAFTDMHDWGDMLVRNGFAEPVMDMERITLTFSSPQSLLQELRGLGRNLHVQRPAGLRGRQWLRQLHQVLQSHPALIAPSNPDGSPGAARLQMSFEIIYGHAFKPVPRVPVAGQSSITLSDMRQALAAGKPGARGPGGTGG